VPLAEALSSLTDHVLGIDLHPVAVALARVTYLLAIGKDRLIAGTDCGFDTFIRFSLVDPGVAWLKLKSLSEGAEIASAEL